MGGRRILARLSALLVVATTLVGASGFDAPARAEGFTVSWPEITDFNPDITEYVVDVTYDGEGYLFIGGGDPWGGSEGFFEPMPSNGSHEVNFPYPIATETYMLLVYECSTPEPTGADCRRLATRFPLTVYNLLLTDLPRHHPMVVGPEETISITSIDPTPDGSLEVSWKVTTRGPDPLTYLTGEAEVPVDGGFRLSDPHGVLPTDTTLLLRLDVEADAGHYGTLHGEIAREIQWDPRNEARLSFATSFAHRFAPSVSTFYPLPDGHGDVVQVDLVGDGVRSGRVRVENGAGRVVFSAPWSPSLAWDGRHQETGQVLPQGRYKVIARSSDGGENVAVTREYLRLSRAELQTFSWTRTFSAQQTLHAERTGECGWIQRPGRPEWPGSVGLRTADRCAGGGSRLAQTVHKIPLPPAVYFTSDAAIEVRGAKAAGELTSGVHLRLREADPAPARWGPWRRYDWEGAFSENFMEVIGNGTRTPRLLLAAAALRGDRFDLGSFTVDVRYVGVSPRE